MSMNSGGAGIRETNEEFVREAQRLVPHLYEAKVYPQQVVEAVRDEQAFQGWRTQHAEDIDSWKERSYGKDDSFILDFGDHHVGYLTLGLKSVGSPQDAPLRLKLIFGEMPCEVAESFDTYDGWLSRAWLQEEIVNVDVLPAVLKLPRRYCFRYLKIVVVDTSRKYTVAFTDIHCTTVTSGDVTRIPPLPEGTAEAWTTMDRIGIKTLQDCMQTVFEDGPKRDRRLWIGDLRLQALANYVTFGNNDLVKRCLYMFGGMTLNGGKVGACVFETPQPLVDDTLLYDYSLFFVATLYDYYNATKDRRALEELWPVAWRQIETALERLDERSVVRDDPSWWCFVDWHPDLNKQAPAQAVLIYAIRRGLALARELGLAEQAAVLERKLEEVTTAAKTLLWDEEKGFFVSGADRQVSWASQIWMVLADVLTAEENAALLDRLFAESPDIRIRTPYMYHHLVEALFLCGKKEQAIEQLRLYWGGMVKAGADTFFEVYQPEDELLSPYGSHLINSYCHAWSCTPTYFIRTYIAQG
ncbi:sugar hydrolase [Paenibacillus chartarius]|uniref:Sugar hydrolase n=1 Tax=Paenibacillus chartarius TaxID=747481 RepID=A0ABV6DR75_9BACL